MNIRIVSLAILMGAVFGGVGTDSYPACSNTIVSETFSPDGRLKAVVFIRDCGAGKTNAHLSVLPMEAVLPDSRGNTFIGEGGLTASDMKEGPRVRVAWLSGTELSVLHGMVRRVRYEENVRGVKVFYGHLVDIPLARPGPP